MSKNKLPALEKRRSFPWQKERLASWLQEWQLACDLQQCWRDAEMRSTSGQAQALALELPPRTGHVRLLCPRTRPAWHTPVHVVLLAQDGPDRFLVAPFGRFAEPAVPSELRTQRSALPLRVLCLWNAHGAHREAMASSWCIDDFSREEIDEALRVYDCTKSGVRMSAALAGRTGPPLIHPDDPRRVYLRQERLRFECILGQQETAYPSVPSSAELPLAAENHEPYGPDRRTPRREADDGPLPG